MGTFIELRDAQHAPARSLSMPPQSGFHHLHLQAEFLLCLQPQSLEDINAQDKLKDEEHIGKAIQLSPQYGP